MIVGLVGKFGAGKTTVSDYLKKKGFTFYSLSDFLRSEATKLGIEHTRDSLAKLGNEYREKQGANFLGKEAVKKIQGSSGDFVVDSIRGPGEVNELRKLEGFVLLGVDASAEVRYERLVERAREGDDKLTFEEFKAQEARENTKKETSQQLDTIFNMADITVDNSSSLEELHKNVDEVLANV